MNDAPNPPGVAVSADDPFAARIRTSPTYALLAAKLGRDPVTVIREMRAQTPPLPFARIADQLREMTDVYITHEWPRRWLIAADEAAAKASKAAA